VGGVGSFDPDGAGPLAAYDRPFLLNVEALFPRGWDVDGDESWGGVSNWKPKVVPNYSGAFARFAGRISAPRTVLLDGDKTVFEIQFDSSHKYTIAAGTGGRLTIGGESGVIDVANGAHEISAPLSFSGAITKSGAGSLIISGVQRHAAGASLGVRDGIVRLDSNAGEAASGVASATAPLGIVVSKPGSVVLGSDQDLRSLEVIFPAPGTQQFDLASGSEPGAVHAVRIYAADLAAAEESLYQAIRNTQSAGAIDPTDGICDSTQALHANSAIGLAQSVDAHGDAMLLLRLTRQGDVNLDGIVSIADFLQLAAHFDGPGTWDEGDLNYDGIVSIADFLLLASNFNTSYDGESFPISPQDQQILSAFQASVPEPDAALVCALGTILLRRRRAEGN